MTEQVNARDSHLGLGRGEKEETDKPNDTLESAAGKRRRDVSTAREGSCHEIYIGNRHRGRDRQTETKAFVR